MRYYNSSALYRLVSIQHRSHRKLLIIDDPVAFSRLSSSTRLSAHRESLALADERLVDPSQVIAV